LRRLAADLPPLKLNVPAAIEMPLSFSQMAFFAC
jgi:hypothetical protein